MNNSANVRFKSVLDTLQRLKAEGRLESSDNLAPYYGIQMSPCESIHMLLEKKHDHENDHLLFHVKYFTKNQKSICESMIQYLPQDICNYIEEYSGNHLDVTYKIQFPHNYPFRPAVWSLCNFTSTIPHKSEAYGGLSLNGYYQYIATLHNEKMMPTESSEVSNWTPAITIEKDVLDFITRIQSSFEFMSL
jgi:hypothetical protein